MMLNETEPVAVGVDIGGTKIAFALVDARGNVLASYRLSTPVDEGPDAVFSQVGVGVAYLLTDVRRPVAGIGIGCPGFLNPETGVVYNATNLNWVNIPLLDGVRQYVPEGIPLWLQKDANASALGEYIFGAARGYDDFVLLTLGTGLGGGALVRGQVLTGANFSGMEVGHMPLKSDGRLCRCGMRGCPEMYVSGVGLLAGVDEYKAAYPDSSLNTLAEVTTADILEARRAGDALAVRVMDEAADWLAQVMITCMGLMNPGMFVIGGGLGHAEFDYFAEAARQKLSQRTRQTLYPEVPIVQSQVQDSAVGAACLVWHQGKGREPDDNFD